MSTGLFENSALLYKQFSTYYWPTPNPERTPWSDTKKGTKFGATKTELAHAEIPQARSDRKETPESLRKPEGPEETKRTFPLWMA